MFIKLYQIRNRGLNDYFLSEIMMNPKNIVYMTENVEMKRLLREGKINLELNSSAGFTNLRFQSGKSIEEIIVVGDPHLIETKIIARPNSQLLRD